MNRSDAELIDVYCRGSHAAFASLVRRHADLVYAVARRRTGDPGLADDVTQAVFIMLMRKADGLRSRQTLAGWLLVVTRHVADTALRGRARRAKHERAAARPETALPDGRPDDRLPVGLMDDALAQLRTADQDAIALRYLQGHTLANVGRHLGVSEDAARKRVDRAVGRLRTLLSRRGVTTATPITAALAALPSPPAPAATIAVVEGLPVLPASRSAVALSREARPMFTLQHLPIVATSVIGLAVVLGVIAVAQTPPAPPAVPLAAPPLPQPSINSLAFELPVTDVDAHISFFTKLGFRTVWTDTPGQGGKVSRASVRCGVVSIRLFRGDGGAVSGPAPFFYIDGGEVALTKLHREIAAQGVAVGDIYNSVRLPQFDVATPDGQKLGFYTAPRQP